MSRTDELDPELRLAYEERAAILEFMGGMSRSDAERLALKWALKEQLEAKRER